jgi:hypothetical protein
MPPMGRAAVVAVAVVSLAGCGGSDDPKAGTTDPVVAESPSETSTLISSGTFTVRPIPSSAPSAECLAAMEAAAAEKDVSAADPLITVTLSACTTVGEWYGGLEQFPGVMGLTDKAALSDLEIQVACHSYPDTPVCADAEAQGLVS